MVIASVEGAASDQLNFPLRRHRRGKRIELVVLTEQVLSEVQRGAQQPVQIGLGLR